MPLILNWRKYYPSPAISFIVSYILLICSFQYQDIYHQYFFSTGWQISLYNIERLYFIACLIFLFYLVGSNVLREPQLNTNAVLLSIFAGASTLQIALLITGLAGLYNLSILMVVTTGIFLMNLQKINNALHAIYQIRTKIYWPGILLISIPLICFLMTKGLFPAGGHDYYIHYFHYYRDVTETGSILPNHTWYHFFYSKGAGLFFLAMLLTDPLGPSLITTALVLSCAGIVFVLIQKKSANKLFPWLGVCFYLGMLIYTPGPLSQMRQGGWGDFEKPHEPASALLFAMLWLIINLANSDKKHLPGLTLTLVSCALIILSPTLVVFSCTFLVLAALVFLFQKNKLAFWWSSTAAGVAGFTFLSTLICNYIFTGVPEDKGMLLFWPLINFDKIKQWGVLFELLMVHWAKTNLVATQIPLNLDLFKEIFDYLRFDIWLPLLSAAIALFALNYAFPTTRQALFKKMDKTALIVMGGFIAFTLLASIFVGRDQPVSYYRFTTFTYAPTLCFCLLLIAPLLKRLVMIATYFGLFIAFLYFLPIANIDFIKGKIIVQNSSRFMRGKISIATAYQNQSSWPGRMPWGAIYPAAETIWRLLPSHPRIWSMNTHTYCMLPDCHIETFLSDRFSPNAELIYYGDAKTAKKILQSENLNYFFFGEKLNLTDPLPLTPLFSPDHIAQYFGIAWTDGENTLLTWKENTTQSIDAKWISAYRKSIAESPTIQTFPFAQLKTALTGFHQGHLKQKELPWYQQGWK